MKYSDLTPITTYRLTPVAWGNEQSIMIDEDAVQQATADAFDLPFDECDPDDDENDRPETIEYMSDGHGKFYAIHSDIESLGGGRFNNCGPTHYREAESEEAVSFGSICMFGEKWTLFDDEDCEQDGI